DPAKVDPVRIGVGDALNQRPLLHAVAAPDAGHGNDLHLPGETGDQLGLSLGEPGLLIDPCPVVTLFRLAGGQVSLVIQARIMFCFEIVSIHVWAHRLSMPAAVAYSKMPP